MQFEKEFYGFPALHHLLRFVGMSLKTGFPVDHFIAGDEKIDTPNLFILKHLLTEVGRRIGGDLPLVFGIRGERFALDAFIRFPVGDERFVVLGQTDQIHGSGKGMIF